MNHHPGYYPSSLTRSRGSVLAMSKPSFINPFSPTGHPVSTSLSKIIDDDEEDSLQLPLPPPLDRSMFLGESFDVTSFLQGRRHLGLDDLRMEVSFLVSSSLSCFWPGEPPLLVSASSRVHIKQPAIMRLYLGPLVGVQLNQEEIRFVSR